MTRVRWYKTGGKRYYVIDVQGFSIYPSQSDTRGATGNVRYEPPTTYAVLDRDFCHREVGVFAPSHGRSSKWCKKQAEALAADLNRRDT